MVIAKQIPKQQLAELIIVARVQPRTSKGITDLLLPQTSIRYKKHEIVLLII